MGPNYSPSGIHGAWGPGGEQVGAGGTLPGSLERAVWGSQAELGAERSWELAG